MLALFFVMAVLFFAPSLNVNNENKGVSLSFSSAEAYYDCDCIGDDTGWYNCTPYPDCGTCCGASSCSPTHYGCSWGGASSQYYSGSAYYWDCSHAYGLASCSEVLAVNGVCSASHYACAAGTSANNVDGAAAWTWNCNGTGGGSNASCSETKPACNLPWGGTIASGQSVTAYASGSYACGSAPVSQTRTCNAGTLSGSYTLASAPAASSRTMYAAATSACGTYSYYSETQYCQTSGAWSGSYTLSSAPAASTRTMYQASSVACGSSCTSQVQSCQSNGAWSGTYAYGSCSVAALNGACSATHYGCSAGTSASNVSNTLTWNWSCTGGCGGSSPACSETKPLPAVPTIGGQTSPIISTSYPYTFQAADPLGSTVSYQIDWDNNSVVDQSSAYSTSNWIFTQNNSWSSAGAKTFKAYTLASDGRSSGWSTYNVTVPTPVNGACNNTAINGCSAGSWTDLADDANNNIWYCAGSNGGANSVNCSYPKTNGACNLSSINGCTTGTLVDTADDASYNNWYCAGANNGTNSPTCQIAKVNGVCSATHYNCSPGTSVNNLSNTTTWTWNCNGSNNGTNSGLCSETKPNPVAPTIGGPTSGAISTSYTYTFTGTDPLSSTVRYGIDWDNNGVADQSSAYGASGWTFSQGNSWAGAGVKTFKARTETSDGRVSGWTTYNVTIVPASTATISTSATPVAYNGSATITWSSTDATSCSVTKAGSAWQSGLSGSVSSGALTANTTFAISCVGTGGNSNNSVTVYVNPSVSISASPTSIAYNASSAITWSSANASSCNIQKGATPNWQTTLSGTSVGTGALTSTTVFTLTCTGPGGTTANTNTTVTVAPLNGACSAGPTHYTCAAGTSVSNVSGPLQWTWTCNGANGGTNASCSETKPNPNPPTIGGPVQGQVSTSYSFTFQATNPSGDGIVYAIDWDNNGTTDQYLPPTGTTTSGTQLSAQNNWAGSGAKTFKARTETNGGPVSGWSSYSIQIYGVPVVTWSPGASTAIPYNGTVNFGYTSTDASSCSYYDLNPSTGATLSTIWSNGATSSSWVSAGPYQADFRRKVVCQNPFAQTGSAEFYVTVYQNGATCGTITVPNYVAPSEVFSGTITMVNSGTNPWLKVGNSATPHRL
ncbi:MAG TPA: hypothetical protein VJ579_01300, partial [Candidatus Paceibacterota bacterium]|nr:hypothetical protein [Candidatus Paceibacterota bacterium]